MKRAAQLPVRAGEPEMMNFIGGFFSGPDSTKTYRTQAPGLRSQS